MARITIRFALYVRRLHFFYTDELLSALLLVGVTLFYVITSSDEP